MHIITGVHGAYLEDYIASELPAGVDVIASIRRFAAVLADRIRQVYPGTSVEVRCDLDISGSLPWDRQTYVLDLFPGLVAEDVVGEIEALRGSITDAEWLVSLPAASDTVELHMGIVGDQHIASLA